MNFSLGGYLKISVNFSNISVLKPLRMTCQNCVLALFAHVLAGLKHSRLFYSMFVHVGCLKDIFLFSGVRIISIYV